MTRDRRHTLASALLCLAAGLLVAAIPLPAWNMRLHAPQYPKGLAVKAYVTHLEGDVAEIDGLNHYIGMRPLDHAARLERGVSVPAIIAMATLLLGAAIVRSRWGALLAAPALTFPVAFLVDLSWWLRDSGMNLDPRAPLSSSIKPFWPPVLGEGVVGQFRTVAWPGPGLVLAAVASGLIVAALLLRRPAAPRPADQPALAAAGGAA